MRLFLAFVVAATPAVADTFAPFSGETDACLGIAHTLMEKRMCVGVAAEACAEKTPDGITIRSMTGCLGAEYAYWDAALNTSYSAVVFEARGVDGHAGNTVLEDHLRSMQRAWVAYRDAACGFERAQYEGGTIGDFSHVDCLVQLTADQTFRLQASVLGF